MEISLRKRVWNDKEERFEPGEIVWAAPCHTEEQNGVSMLVLDEVREERALL